jgi:2-oxoglutarate ferredoxin oxidoreductase subunit beta
MNHKAEGKLLTGLIYIDPEADNFHEMTKISHTPLNELGKEKLCPGASTLKDINDGFR